MKSYKFRIHPSKEQINILNLHLTLCCNLYNACIYQRKLAYVNCSKSIACARQQSQLPELKKNITIYSDVYSQVLQDVIKRVDKAFKNFFLRFHQGKKGGYPRFKSVNRYNSFTYPQFGFRLVNNRLILNKVGDVKVKLHRKVVGDIKTLTIKKDRCDDWWICLSVDGSELPNKKQIKNVVGIDLGIKKLITLSTGEFFENKKHIKQQEKKLKRLDRQLSKKKKYSNNRIKARLKRARAYRKLMNQRNDYLHKISRYMVNKFDLIGFEKLNINGMTKNNYLAKSILDCSWNQLIQFTSYKAEEAGKTIVFVDPKNTSQECSKCGELVRKSLSVRLHVCPTCSFVADRDLNASFNILNRALQKIGREPSEFTSVEIGVQSLVNITDVLSRSMNQEAFNVVHPSTSDAPYTEG